jgi:hypothetical protein
VTGPELDLLERSPSVQARHVHMDKLPAQRVLVAPAPCGSLLLRIWLDATVPVAVAS